MRSIKDQLVEQLQQADPNLLQSVIDLQKEKLAKELARIRQTQIEHDTNMFELKCKLKIDWLISEIRKSHRVAFSDFKDLCAIFADGIGHQAFYVGYKDIWMSFDGVLLLALIQLKRAEYYSLIRTFKAAHDKDVDQAVKNCFWSIAKKIEKEGLRDEN